MSNFSAETFWLNAWYQGRWWLWLLWPLSALLRGLAAVRRNQQSRNAESLAAPVIIVGNITLGGTGKTPTIIAMVRYLQAKGLNPGVLSRGYGGVAPFYPYPVTASTDVKESGDEPLLIAMETGCPVVVGPDRVASAKVLIEEHQCDLLLSDDGLQHYRLQRQWELCLLDGERLWGNGLCLPAGPLRESTARLAEVDAIIVNGERTDTSPAGSEAARRLSSAHTMTLAPNSWQRLHDGESLDIPLFTQRLVSSVENHAVTGIGNPHRFFKTLASLGIDCQARAFPDHHAFQPSDLSFADNNPLLMTAKDAVKCRSFAKPDWWYLSVDASLPDAFWAQLDDFLREQTLVS